MVLKNELSATNKVYSTGEQILWPKWHAEKYRNLWEGVARGIVFLGR